MKQDKVKSCTVEQVAGEKVLLPLHPWPVKQLILGNKVL
jgi:hypothetical protein